MVDSFAIVKTGEPYQGCVSSAHANGQLSRETKVVREPKSRNGYGDTVSSFSIAL